MMQPCYVYILLYINLNCIQLYNVVVHLQIKYRGTQTALFPGITDDNLTQYRSGNSACIPLPFHINVLNVKIP